MSNRVLQSSFFVFLFWVSSLSLVGQVNFHENLVPGDRRGQSQAERWLLIEAEILLEVNRLRRSRGLSGLRPHPLLSDIARRHSHDMIERHYFDHMNPELHTPDERVHHRMGDSISDLAENLWMRLGALPYESPKQSAQSIVGDWLFSPGHRENLLEPRFTHLGVGFYGSDDGLRLRATQLFAGMIDSAVAAVLPQP